MCRPPLSPLIKQAFASHPGCFSAHQLLTAQLPFPCHVRAHHHCFSSQALRHPGRPTSRAHSSICRNIVAPIFARDDPSGGCQGRTVLDILWSCLATMFATLRTIRGLVRMKSSNFSSASFKPQYSSCIGDVRMPRTYITHC